jgi:tRNA modification GTPase
MLHDIGHGATIFAPVTASGRAGVQIIRLSGPDTGNALVRLRGGKPLPPPRRATLTALISAINGEIFDRGMVLWFPGPNSFTGEDTAELHVHGGRAVLQAAVETLLSLGLRMAEPGEFTRRAFEHGKLDLTEAEAIADLVDAETAAQRRQALRQMQGDLGQLYEGWRKELLRALAYLEADIDFAEDDVPDDLSLGIKDDLTRLVEAMGAHLADAGRGERLREGISVVIIGPPNAGKSSLLNALARRDVAIVSAEAGTTRDIIEIQIDLKGYPVILADTAGLRQAAQSAIESEGMRRALARAGQADLRIIALDGAALTEPISRAELEEAMSDTDCLLVLNKCDLLVDGSRAGLQAQEKRLPPFLRHLPTYWLSAQTGHGVQAFLDALAGDVARVYAPTAAPLLTRTRHRVAVEACRAHLLRALSAHAPELVAEDARLAMRALGRITGRVDVEDLLDVIFRDFCIGK